MLKHVEGNPNLFKQTKLQLQLNLLDKKMDPRYAESCCDFYTGDMEEDPRKTHSFPASPRFMENWKGVDVDEMGPVFDNVYNDVKGKRGAMS
jgi:hypothetical protein